MHNNLMAAPSDVMGPPPVPAQGAQQPSQKGKGEGDLTEKYKRLKRKYFELEEKHKEAVLQLKSSGERNVKWRSERNLLLDRITELETTPSINRGAPIPMPPFSAFPRSLLSTRAQQTFVNNLRVAMEETEREDPAADPLLASRHVGPAARKRQEAEAKERQEEEAREARRAARRPRTTNKGKEVGTPLSFAPAHSPAPMQVAPWAPVLVSSGGTRLKLKGPAPPDEDPRREGYARPLSPLSPRALDDEYGAPPGAHYAEPPLPPPTQAQMQMTLRSAPGPMALARPSGHAKPKRLKAHTVTSKRFSIPHVPRDKKGRPQLPLNVGIMTVHNLGEICTREHFHTERYIFPINYEVTRRYYSTINPTAETVYRCKILDGGDGPIFHILGDDMPPQSAVTAGTATGAWSVIVRAANHIRQRVHSNSVSGPDFFGLGQNTIKALIQELHGANQLKNYVQQVFKEGGHMGGRHAAVLPVHPEDHDQDDDDDLDAASISVSHPGSASSNGPTNGYFADRAEYEHERPREIQVIEEDPGAGRRTLPPPPPPPLTRPLQFHQEYAPPPERPRRNSRVAAGHDDYYDARGGSPPPRTVSHSPVQAREHERDERDFRSPPLAPNHSRSHSAHSHASAHHSPTVHHRSPYPPAGGPSPPPMPATFASILHPYPDPRDARPPAGEPPSEYVYANGSGRRNGHAAFSANGER